MLVISNRALDSLNNKVLKRLSYILFSVSIILIASIQGFGQVDPLPMACTGSIERYWVKGFNGQSVFTWTITDSDGNVLPSSFYTLIGSGRGDSIQINWDSALKGGIYTFTVVEHLGSGPSGCAGDGEPYSQDIMLNSPTINIPFEGVPTSVAVCYGNQAALDPGLFLNYLWQDNSTNRIFYTGTAGTYQVRLINPTQSCSYNEIEAVINPLPYVWLGNDTTLFNNQSLVLDASVDPSIMSYIWSTGSILPSITVTNVDNGNMKVWVTVTDANTCQNSDTIKIDGYNIRDLRIPHAFTPNGDGINDKWYFPAPPLGTTVNQDLYPYFDNISVRIFNRWGKLVWESNNKFVAWDGKDLHGENLPMDSYHYLIRLVTKDNETLTFKGSITIVR
jgi:gliding motility-associated-like protein